MPVVLHIVCLQSATAYVEKLMTSSSSNGLRKSTLMCFSTLFVSLFKYSDGYNPELGSFSEFFQLKISIFFQLQGLAHKT